MKPLLPLLFFPFVAAIPAAAQHTGFSLGVGVQHTSQTVAFGDFADEDEEVSGVGLGLTAAYGFSNLISAFLTLDGSSVSSDDADDGDGTLAHADLGVRFHFRAQPQLFPYVQAALSGIAISGDDEGSEITFSGGGFTLGGGVKYFLSPRLALDGTLAYSGGQYTQVEVDGETFDDFEFDASSLRIRAGIEYYFGRR